jgi:hypothetical protein
MIESKNDTSKNLEKALQALKQAQQRVANEKKKQNEKKRKAEKPLPHNPLSPMPKMKARAVRNDKGEDTGKPR